jgi:hypothetical protein
MTDPFEVVWSDRATADWHQLPFREAEAVAVAVRSFAQTGEGTVIAGDGGEYLLFVGELVVVILIDADTLHIWRVRHA